jgi:hypothetical protein
LALVQSFSTLSCHPGTGALIAHVPSLPGEVLLFACAACLSCHISDEDLILRYGYAERRGG